MFIVGNSGRDIIRSGVECHDFYMSGGDASSMNDFSMRGKCDSLSRMPSMTTEKVDFHLFGTDFVLIVRFF